MSGKCLMLLSPNKIVIERIRLSSIFIRIVFELVYIHFRDSFGWLSFRCECNCNIKQFGCLWTIIRIVFELVLKIIRKEFSLDS